MTIDQESELRKRLAAAMKCDDWGNHGRWLFAAPEKPGANAKVWYGDGDLCAEVHGNLGLGINGDAIAEFFANSMADMQRLLEDRDRHKAALTRYVNVFLTDGTCPANELLHPSAGHAEGEHSGVPRP